MGEEEETGGLWSLKDFSQEEVPGGPLPVAISFSAASPHFSHPL